MGLRCWHVLVGSPGCWGLGGGISGKETKGWVIFLVVLQVMFRQDLERIGNCWGRVSGWCFGRVSG